MAARRRWRRILAGLGLGGIAVTGAGLLGFVGLGLWLRTASGNRWIEGQVESRADAWVLTEGHLDLEGLSTDLWSGVVLSGLTLTRGDGATLVQLTDLTVELDLMALTRGLAHVPRVQVGRANVAVELLDDGTLDVLALFGLYEPGQWSGLPVDVAVDEVRVLDGSARVVSGGADLVAVDGLELSLSMSGSGRRVEVHDLTVGADLTAPAALPLAATGSAAYTGDGVELGTWAAHLGTSSVSLEGGLSGLEGEAIAVELGVGVERLAMADVDALVGAGLAGAWGGNVAVSGPLTDVVVTGRLDGLEGTEGALVLGAGADLLAPELPWRASAEVLAVHAEDVLPALGDPVVLNGAATVEGAGASWPDGITATGRFEGGPQTGYGLTLEEVSAGFSLDGGVATLDGTRVSGPPGVFDVTGTVDLGEGPVDIGVAGTVEVSALEAFGFPGTWGQAAVDLDITGDLFAEDLLAAGTAELGPAGWGPDIRLGGATASYQAHLLGVTVDLTADAVAWRGSAYGAELDRVAVPRVTAHLGDDGAMSAAGRAVAQGARYPGVADLDAFTANFSGAMGANGAVSARVGGTTGALSVVDLSSTAGAFTASLDRGVLRFDADLRDGARPWFLSEGFLDLEQQAGEVSTLRWYPTRRQRWEETSPLTFDLTASGVTDARVDLDGGGLGSIQITGRDSPGATVGLDGELDALVRVSGLELDVGAELLPDLLSGLSGQLDLTADVGGTAAAPDVAVDIDARRVWIADLSRWLDVGGTVHASDDTVRPDLVIGAAGSPLFEVRGSVPARLALTELGPDPDGELDLSVVVVPGSLERVTWLSPVDLPLPEGELSGQVDVTGPLVDPDVYAAGLVQVRATGLPDTIRAELLAHRQGEDVSFHTDVREGMRRIASVEGRGRTGAGEVLSWALAGGPEPDLTNPEQYLTNLYVGVDLDRVPIERAVSVLGLPVDLAGELSGLALVSGSPLRPTVGADLRVDGLRVGEVEADQAVVTLAPMGAAYDLYVHAGFPEQDGGLNVSGRIPTDLDLMADMDTWFPRPMSLKLSGPGVPLAMATAVDPAIQDVDGLLRLDGTVSGTPLAPLPDLHAHIDDGTLAFAPLGVRFTDLRLDVGARWSPGSKPVTLDFSMGSEAQHPGRALWSTGDFSVLTRGDPLLGDRDTPAVAITGGQIELGEDYLPARVDVPIALRRALLAGAEDLAMMVSGDLAITSGWPALMVRGDVVVERGFLNVDTTYFMSMAPLNLDRSIAVHRTGSRVEAADLSDDGPPIYADFDVDVGVDLQRNMDMRVAMPFVDNLGSAGAAISTVMAEVRVGGEVEALVRDEALGLHGEVDVLDGAAHAVLAKFDLDRGTVVFAGPDFMNPFIDLDASMPVRGGGTVRMHATGTPFEPEIEFTSEEYPDQSQIMLILVTGQAPNDMDGAKATNAFMELAGRSLLGGSGLGQIRFDPDGSLRVGLPVPSSKVGLEWIWTPKPGLERNQMTLDFEYQVAPQLVLSGAWGSRRSWIDVYLERRF